MCLTSREKLRTGSRLSLVLRFVGVKSNLSSGIASTRSTACFSSWLIWRSTTPAMVGGGEGGAVCAGDVGAADFGAAPDAWPSAPMARLTTNSRVTILRYDMQALLVLDR